MKKLLIVAILGVLTFFTPFTLKADYSSLDEPIAELNQYTLRQAFGNILHPLNDYIIHIGEGFDYDNYSFDYLNGNTIADLYDYQDNTYDLTNITANPNFNDNLTGWTTVNASIINNGAPYQNAVYLNYQAPNLGSISQDILTI